MFEREEIVSTYIGNGIAIPHGVGKARGLIKSSGLVILQYPDGIDYNGNTCYLVIGISGKDNDHIKILANIAEQFSDEEQARKLWKTSDKDLLFSLLTKGS
jgi:PTS system mannitol-specific IIC component